ncbi:MAG TPA: hypothetical protein VNA12_05075 [Mycobacteriales bacterium]|nr:hypothetical protein [Mycobacteriales bacterium]
MTRPRTAVRALVGFALAVVVGHHNGTLLKPLGTVGVTEWADWTDLVVPFAVLGTAAAVLVATEATARVWTLFAVGALLYTQGHGIHLAANSVANAGPVGDARDTAHLWDEVVGHYIWYAGLAAVVLAMLLAAARARVPARAGAAAYLLAALVGFTWTTNGIEGGTVPLSVAAASGLIAVAARDRDGAAARLVIASFGLSLVLLAGWGVWHRGFPQFSELGWI